MVVFFAAILSAGINALIYKFADCGSRQLNSPALAANAEHNKIDAASGILVAIGVLATRAGLHWIDPLIAIVESLHTLHGSAVIFKDAIKNLLDASLPQEYITDITEQVSQVKNVQRVNIMRARQSGSKIFLDFEIEIDPQHSVLASKKIKQTIKDQLRKKNNYIGNIHIMVVPGEVEPKTEGQARKLLTSV